MPRILKFKGKMSLKSKLLIILAIIILIVIIGVTILYASNEEVRDWINTNILNKEVTEDDVATIEIESDKTQYIYAYDKYITILCNGKLKVYNSYGAEIHELDVNISNPIFEANEEYLAIAESSGQKVYLISERKNIVDNISRRNNRRNRRW